MPTIPTGPNWHPAAYHSLDVAACGLALLEQDPGLAASIDRVAQLAPGTALRWIPFILALHDLGKFSVPFQRQVPDLAASLLGLTTDVPSELRHDSLGYQFFVDRLAKELARWDVLDLHSLRKGKAQPAKAERAILDLLDPWMRASCGHHGKPPCAGELDGLTFPILPAQAALSYVRDVLEILSPGHMLAETQALRRSSWLVAGVAVLADWLGSNQGYFAYRDPDQTLRDYWAETRVRASRAIRESGVVAPQAAPWISIQELFDNLTTPSPVQECCASLPIEEGPELVLVEDATGSGKTEAAMLLAHRWMAAGKATGVYFALPTMATANGMVRRVTTFYERLYQDGQASLVLAHGRSALFERLRDTPLDLTSEGQDTATRHCTAWLSDGKKKALLAPVGVGTVDQAMLGILPAKHSPLRVLGVHRKVLVVDEVHACDTYMLEILKALLEMQAGLGGSAILLSATLPEHVRAALVAAFQKPLGRKDPVERQDYPLLTVASQERVKEIPCQIADRSRRSVDVEFVDKIEQVVELLVTSASAGHCAVWIRNTVTDAIKAREIVEREAKRRGLSSLEIDLFHARFILGGRIEIEKRILESFGKQSGPAERRGRILIATQVVEQSLDLDFDVMISDLAPVELLIQRAGRLHRHARRGDGSPSSSGVDERSAPVLNVLAPAWANEPEGNWIAGSAIPLSGVVYPDVARLWGTMNVLRQKGALVVPEDSRWLVESVYGAGFVVPEGLSKLSNEALGKDMVAASIGHRNALPFEQGYLRDNQHWLEDTRTPTRLGDETTTVRLALVEHGTTVPFFRHPTEHYDRDVRWELSQADIRTTKVASCNDEDRDVKAARLQMRDEGRWCVPVVMTPELGEGGTQYRGHAFDVHQSSVDVLYSERLGLWIERKKKAR